MLNMPTSGREAIGHDRRRRNLDHRGHERDPAALRAAIGSMAALTRANLTGLGHHRNQDPQLGRISGLEDGLELRGKRLGILKEKFHTAPVGSFKKRGRLVTPEVEQANGRGEAPEGRQHRLQGPAVFGHRRPMVRLEEGQLGSKQSDPVGAGLERRAYPRWMLRHLASTRTDLPSRVTVGRARAAIARPCASRAAAIAVRTACTLALSGDTMTALLSASTMHGSPSLSERMTLPRPTTMGSPSPRATMAACPVTPPPRALCRTHRCRAR